MEDWKDGKTRRQKNYTNEDQSIEYWKNGRMDSWLDSFLDLWDKQGVERKNIKMKHKVLLCVDNEGYKASLEIRKLYEKIPDKEAERHNQVRIIDESGEDYLYPSSFFAPVRLSIQTQSRILEKAAQIPGSATRFLCGSA